MNRQEILVQVIGLYQEVSDRMVDEAADADLDADLAVAPDWDELDKIEFEMGLEETFGIDISEADAVGLTTLNKVVDYLASRLL